jgi:type VI secretion system protein ImpA
MQTALNIETLLNPIAGDAPSGEDLRYSEVYDHIKEARRADEQLAQGEWLTDVKTADWRKVAQLSTEALAERSKDMQIAVWLTEAWTHLHGYGGLAAGLELIHRLMQDFWPTLLPPIDDGDLDYRIGPLVFLNERLPSTVYRVPLCDPAHSRGFGYYHLEESRLVGAGHDLDKEQKKRREALIAEGKISAEDFTTAVNASSMTFYQNAANQLRRCRAALAELDRIATEKFAPNPPGFGHLIKAVESCSGFIERVAKDKSRSEVVPQEEEPAHEAPESRNPIEISDSGESMPQEAISSGQAISDITPGEQIVWRQVSRKLEQGMLKPAMDQLLSCAAISPSVRGKNRYYLMLAKLCLKADRADLASPITEELYQTIETMQLEKWEHSAWIADVVETLYRCMTATEQAQSDRSRILFQKLCLLNVAKAAAYRLNI